MLLIYSTFHYLGSSRDVCLAPPRSTLVGSTSEPNPISPDDPRKIKSMGVEYNNATRSPIPGRGRYNSASYNSGSAKDSPRRQRYV